MQQQRIQVALRLSNYPVARGFQKHMLRALEALVPHAARRDHNVFIIADETLEFAPNDMERRARRFTEACIDRLLDPNTETGQHLRAHLVTTAIDVYTGLAYDEGGVVYVELADPLTDEGWLAQERARFALEQERALRERERALAFAQGAHSRLGAESLVRTLPIELAHRILRSS